MSDNIEFRIILERQEQTGRERYRIQADLGKGYEGYGTTLFGKPILFDDIESAKDTLNTLRSVWLAWELVEVVE